MGLALFTPQMSEHTSKDIKWQHLDKRRFYAFCVLGFVSLRTLTFPAGLIKTRLQNQRAHTGTQYRGGFDAFLQIVRRERLRGLYKGYLPLTLGMVPTQMIYLSVLEGVRSHAQVFTQLQGDTWGPASARNALAGACASMSSLCVVVPTEVISQQLMVQEGRHDRFSSTRSAMRAIYQQEGIRGFYRGWGATVCVYAPNSCIWWSSYGAIKPSLQRLREWLGDTSNPPSWGTQFLIEGLSGSCSGVIASTLTNPIDVAKTRIQILDEGPASGPRRLVPMMRALYVEAGWRAFTRGLSARIFNSIQVSFLLIVGYEQIKRWSLVN